MPAYEPGVCEIDLWRGYVKAEFVAIVRDGDEAYEAARSPAFRFRGDGAPDEDDERVTAAYAALLDVLSEQGWEPVGGGRPWFSYRFRRRPADVHSLPLPVTAREHLASRREPEAATEPSA
jgi:hypothetical protein